MNEYIEISWDEFEAKYKPQKNHLDDNASLDSIMFETFGDEMEYIRQVAKEHPERVWTYSDGDDSPTLSNGLSFVNRLGYVVTERPSPHNKFIAVVD